MNDIEFSERYVAAHELLARSLARLADLTENRFNIDFPKKRDPQDVTLTRVPTEEDKLRERQGSSDEPIEEWIGIREKQVIEGTKGESPR